MWQRLGRFARISASEQWLALRALGTLALVRVALGMLPFAKVRALMDRVATVPMAASDSAVSRAVRRAVDRAARTVPGSACLAQALTAELLLRRAGQPASVSIGVAPDGEPLDAHAWVESNGIVVTGDSADIGRYRTLAVFSSDSQTPRY